MCETSIASHSMSAAMLIFFVNRNIWSGEEMNDPGSRRTPRIQSCISVFIAIANVTSAACFWWRGPLSKNFMSLFAPQDPSPFIFLYAIPPLTLMGLATAIKVFESQKTPRRTLIAANLFSFISTWGMIFIWMLLLQIF